MFRGLMCAARRARSSRRADARAAARVQRPVVARLSALSEEIPMHHPAHARVMTDLLSAKEIPEMLEIFDRERHHYGWFTAKETITRVAKRAKNEPDFKPSEDERFMRLLDIPQRALDQQVMCSQIRKGEQSDDLSRIAIALEELDMADTDLYVALETKLAEEAKLWEIEEEENKDGRPGEL